MDEIADEPNRKRQPMSVAPANVLDKTRGPVIYGWLFAGHQLGGAIAAQGAARLRDWTGSYKLSFIIGGIFCLIAAVGSLRIKVPKEPASASDQVFALA